MYQCVKRSRNGLGFSMPSWIASTGSAIVKGVTLTVQTPLGPLSMTPQQAAAAARGAKVTYSPPRPAGSSNPAAEFVEQNVPGGWGTVALGIGAVALLMVMKGRR